MQLKLKLHVEGRAEFAVDVQVDVESQSKVGLNFAVEGRVEVAVQGSVDVEGGVGVEGQDQEEKARRRCETER